MKKTYLNLVLAISLLLQSCYQDEIISESCLVIDKITQSSGPTQVEVGKTKEIIFKVSSSCDVDFFVTDSKIFDNFTEISFQGIDKNEIYKPEGFEFILLYSPKTKGVKTVSFSIYTNIGQVIINLGVEGI
ncbi:hypothetical protein [Polaribacter sp. Hel_I_88]|uniref:hypothetical protein n=1 Tax=Polaribacter sp. Hel_I_88 TaxID=1250006 RepID=UPI00047BA936|nr:hypothetical protein [Polaribacter sp. Hel_I_88]